MVFAKTTFIIEPKNDKKVNETLKDQKLKKGLSHVEKRPAAFFRIKKELPDF